MFNRRSLAGVVLVALLAVACGAPTTGPAPSSGPKQITVGVGIDLTSLEMTDRNEETTFTVAFNVAEGLFRRGPDYKMQNILAESFKANADSTVWDVTLRKNVKFHNGDVLDANAVKFTFDKILDPNRKPASILLSTVSFVKSVDVVDTNTARFTLKNPNLFFREAVANSAIVDPKYYAANDAAYLGTHLNGTGPFKLVEWVKGDHTTLEANADYWGGRPKLDKIVYKVIPEAGARIAALKTGDVDIIDRVAIDNIDQLSSEQNIKVASVPAERTITIGINQLKGQSQLKDIQLRQAMNYAVDVNSIVKNLLKGRGDRVPTIIAKQTFGFSELQPFAYDPNKAKQMIADLKLPADFTLRFTAPDGNFPKDKEVAQAVADFLRAAGLKVNLELYQGKELINLKNQSKLGDIWMIGWQDGSFDGLADMTWIAKSKSTLWAEQYTTDPESDRLMDLAGQQTDPEKRASYLKDVQKLFLDKAYSIFMYSTWDAYGYRTRVQNFNVPADEILTIGKDVTVQ